MEGWGDSLSSLSAATAACQLTSERGRFSTPPYANVSCVFGSVGFLAVVWFDGGVAQLRKHRASPSKTDGDLRLNTNEI